MYVVGSMYVRKYFDERTRHDVVEIVNNIKMSVEEAISKADWMSENVKEKAMKKLKMMKQFVAYSDEFLDRTTVDELHGGIVAKNVSFFANVLNIYKFWRRNYYSNLHKPIDPSSWMEHRDVAVVNAFYDRSMNYMDLPAGILQVIYFYVTIIIPQLFSWINFFDHFKVLIEKSGKLKLNLACESDP